MFRSITTSVYTTISSFSYLSSLTTIWKHLALFLWRNSDFYWRIPLKHRNAMHNLLGKVSTLRSVNANHICFISILCIFLPKEVFVHAVYFTRDNSIGTLPVFLVLVLAGWVTASLLKTEKATRKIVTLCFYFVRIWTKHPNSAVKYSKHFVLLKHKYM